MSETGPGAGSRRRLADLVTDGAGIAGAALITYGVWLVHHPAAFIVAGSFLLIGAWLTARKGAS
jgi:hypothetical protein